MRNWLKRVGPYRRRHPGDLRRIAGWMRQRIWDAVVGIPGDDLVASSHPLLVCYVADRKGRQSGIVHGTGGFLTFAAAVHSDVLVEEGARSSGPTAPARPACSIASEGLRAICVGQSAEVTWISTAQLEAALAIVEREASPGRRRAPD
jgi:hypothetical protein